MSRVNHEEESIITGKVRPRMIKSKVNSCLGGKIWRINYPEEKVRGKDGAKPSVATLSNSCFKKAESITLQPDKI